MAVAEPVIAARPLCVQLDGGLIRGDLRAEALLALLKREPLALLGALPRWLTQSSAFRAELAQRAALDVRSLPYDPEMLVWLKEERAAGRSIWLCSVAGARITAAVAEHVGLFDGVVTSGGEVSPAESQSGEPEGSAISEALARKFGVQGFDYYAGRRGALAGSQRVLGAEATAGAHGARFRGPQVAVPVVRTRRRLRPILKLMRPHQWAKNALLLVPLAAAHGAGGTGALPRVLLATLAFCLCASSVYVVNDIIDLESDRRHAHKSRRPLAAGSVSLSAAFALAPTLLVAAAFISAFLPLKFQFVIGVYWLLTIAYSLRLKGIVLVDAICLAALYTLRVMAGAAAAGVALSFWLLIFSIFLFLSLAFVKRYAELDSLRRESQLHAAGRGYHVEDLPVLQSLGTAAGYLSVLVLALYINSPDIERLYRRPKFIWLLCVLMLYWISRVWMKAHRGTMHDDPVVFALKDRISLMIGLAAAFTVSLAI